MKLSFPAPPSEIENSLFAFPFLGEGGLTGEFESGFGPSDKVLLAEFRPHYAFYLAPEDLFEDTISESAKFYGWRNILEGRDEGVLAALIRNEASPDEANLVELNIGRYVDGSFEAFQLIQAGMLEGLPEFGTFEFRVLLVPSLCLFTIWLHGENEDGGDYFAIHPPGPDPTTPLDSFDVHQEEYFLQYLRKLQSLRGELWGRQNRNGDFPSEGEGEGEGGGFITR